MYEVATITVSVLGAYSRTHLVAVFELISLGSAAPPTVQLPLAFVSLPVLLFAPIPGQQKAIDYLSFVYSEGMNVYLEGQSMSARQLVGVQAKTSNMADGDEYLTVRTSHLYRPSDSVVAFETSEI